MCAIVNQSIIGPHRFKNLKASYLATGLTARVHGNSKRQPKNTLNMEEIKNLVTFLNNHAEKNAILLPGRIPGYKRDTIQLLPSSTTKKVQTSLTISTQCTNTLHLHLTLPVYCTVGCVGRVQTVGRWSWHQSSSIYHFLLSLASACSTHHSDEADVRPVLGVPTK